MSSPGDNYVQLQTYCSITLMSCIGKVVKTVFAELVSEDGERRELLSDRQFGSRKGQSTMDAATHMVDKSHAAWKTAT